MIDRRKPEAGGDSSNATMVDRIARLRVDLSSVRRQVWLSPMNLLREVLYYFDTKFEVSDLAKAAGKGERLVIRDWQRARESESFVTLAHIQRYEWVLPNVAGLDCLDAGCGSGYGAYHLATNGANSVVGVDLSRVAIRFAKSKYISEALQFGTMDVRNLAAKNDSFDAVISFDVMEHMERGCQDSFVSEMARVLSPRGRAYIGCPNSSASSETNPFHLGELTRKEFETLLRKHFRDVRVLGQDLIHEGRRQYGDLSIVGKVRGITMGNFIIVNEEPEATYGLLGVCENPFKNIP